MSVLGACPACGHPKHYGVAQCGVPIPVDMGQDGVAWTPCVCTDAQAAKADVVALMELSRKG